MLTEKSTYNTPNGGEKCDDDSSSLILGKWYRFVGDAGTKIPTQRVPEWRCGAALSGWLKGDHPTLADREVSSKVCFTRGGNCCSTSIKIYGKDWGSYFINKLLKPPTCDSHYCGTDLMNKTWAMLTERALTTHPMVEKNVTTIPHP